MQRFCDPMVCYFGFLAAISNTEIVQSMWLCPPPDRLPVIQVVLSYLKTNSSRSHIFRPKCGSQDTFCLLYQEITYLL